MKRKHGFFSGKKRNPEVLLSLYRSPGSLKNRNQTASCRKKRAVHHSDDSEETGLFDNMNSGFQLTERTPEKAVGTFIARD
jgi:hypothetical protein